MATYGTTDRCTGGATNEGTLFDNDTNTQIEYLVSNLPINYYYDFGASKSWKISKVRLYVVNYAGLADFDVLGSDNGSNWTTLYSGARVNNYNSWQEFTFTNKKAYRYCSIYCKSSYDGYYMRLAEIEMMEGIYPIIKTSFSGFSPWVF